MFDSIPKFCVVLQNVRNLLQQANNDIVSDERLGMDYVSAAYLSLCLFFSCDSVQCLLEYGVDDCAWTALTLLVGHQEGIWPIKKPW